ncbi:MAG: hypothetical protein AABZ57_02780, partial [Candidatus Margulisiibacteriota bacterium]
YDECQSRIIVTAAAEQIFALNDIAMINKTPVSIIGKAGGKNLEISNAGKKLVKSSVARLTEAYKGSLPRIMGA